MITNLKTSVIKQLGFLFFVLLNTNLWGQTLNGPTTVEVGDTDNYYLTNTSFISPGTTWWESDGVIQGNPYGVDAVDINWPSVGSNKSVLVDYIGLDDDYYFREVFVEVETVSMPGPDTPTTPIIQSINCGNTVLQRGTPPTGVTWYWQSYSSGTSTSNSSSTITRTSGTIYYLRARNSSNVWSTSSSSIAYTVDINTSWYADTDGDGLGDPNNTLSVCTGQPIGYVADNSDQCPTEYGFVANNGCPTSTSSGDQNYIHTIQPQIEVTDISTLTDNQIIESIVYFDGLGRTKQSIAIRAGGNSEDIITHVDYDAYGRQVKDYLPYANSSAGGSYNTDALNSTNSFYNTSKYEYTPNPYSEKLFEASPLNRVLEQTAPGASWKAGTSFDTNGHSNGNTIKFGYKANTTNEVRLYKVNLVFANNTYTPSLVNATTYYSPNELYKSITKDENWKTSDDLNKTTEEFKDKQGKVVLKRTYNASAKHDTYYVYDDYGNLTYVLPPKMEATTASVTTINSQLSELGYQYKYDHRNRLVEKKIPGKDWESIVYDNLDRPVLTQDAIQADNDEWLFTKYDVFGRVAYTGIYNSSLSRTSLQTTFNAKPAVQNYESRASSSTDFDNSYYTNQYFPNLNLQLLTINYYDDYTFDKDGLSLPSSWDGQSIVNYNNATRLATKGLATGSKVRVLETSNWITNITGYDVKGRPIYMASKNSYLETTDIVKSTLDFVGKTTKTVSTHIKGTNDPIVITDSFTYDQMGRLLKQTQQIGNENDAIVIGASSDAGIAYIANTSITLTPGFTALPGFSASITSGVSASAELIVSNTYDELGQLKNKKVGGNDLSGNTGLQTVDYTYNIRGWLKQINNPTSLGTDLFAFKLNYNTASHGATALFNGNIAETEWKTANDNSLRWYKYGYDALNRITAATDNINRYSLSNLNYDKNGNITTLQRGGNTNSGATSFGTMDNLIYTYQSNSNKLVKVLDNGNNTYGFKDGINTTTEFTYDTNGNMLKDLNKGITAITYNHLNLPTKVTLSGGNISYIYDATGIKLKKTVSTGATTDYAGNFIYQDGDLQFFNTSEGYVEPNTSNGFNYIYQYKDHLGNIRLSYTDTNGNGSIATTEIVEENNYYPFGLKHKGYNNNITSTNIALKKMFGGKELQDDNVGGNQLNWYDFGARNYDASLGRWMNLDPLAEKYLSFTPYNFVANSPLIATDLDGKKIDYSELTRDERKQIRRSLRSRRRNSKTFRKEFRKLKKSELTYTFDTSERRGVAGFSPTHPYKIEMDMSKGYPEPIPQDASEAGGRISINKNHLDNSELLGEALSEEIVHANQFEFYTGVNNAKNFQYDGKESIARGNIEFEAKMITGMINQEAGLGFYTNKNSATDIAQEFGTIYYKIQDKSVYSSKLKEWSDAEKSRGGGYSKLAIEARDSPYYYNILFN